MTYSINKNDQETVWTRRSEDEQSMSVEQNQELARAQMVIQSLQDENERLVYEN